MTGESRMLPLKSWKKVKKMKTGWSDVTPIGLKMVLNVRTRTSAVAEKPRDASFY